MAGTSPIPVNGAQPRSSTAMTIGPGSGNHGNNTQANDQPCSYTKDIGGGGQDHAFRGTTNCGSSTNGGTTNGGIISRPRHTRPPPALKVTTEGDHVLLRPTRSRLRSRSRPNSLCSTTSTSSADSSSQRGSVCTPTDSLFPDNALLLSAINNDTNKNNGVLSHGGDSGRNSHGGSSYVLSTSPRDINAGRVSTDTTHNENPMRNSNGTSYVLSTSPRDINAGRVSMDAAAPPFGGGAASIDSRLAISPPPLQHPPSQYHYHQRPTIRAPPAPTRFAPGSSRRSSAASSRRSSATSAQQETTGDGVPYNRTVVMEDARAKLEEEKINLGSFRNDRAKKVIQSSKEDSREENVGLKDKNMHLMRSKKEVERQLTNRLDKNIASEDQLIGALRRCETLPVGSRVKSTKHEIQEAIKTKITSDEDGQKMFRVCLDLGKFNQDVTHEVVDHLLTITSINPESAHLTKELKIEFPKTVAIPKMSFSRSGNSVEVAVPFIEEPTLPRRDSMDSSSVTSENDLSVGLSLMSESEVECTLAQIRPCKDVQQIAAGKMKNIKGNLKKKFNVKSSRNGEEESAGGIRSILDRASHQAANTLSVLCDNIVSDINTQKATSATSAAKSYDRLTTEHVANTRHPGNLLPWLGKDDPEDNDRALQANGSNFVRPAKLIPWTGKKDEDDFDSGLAVAGVNSNSHRTVPETGYNAPSNVDEKYSGGSESGISIRTEDLESSPTLDSEDSAFLSFGDLSVELSDGSDSDLCN